MTRRELILLLALTPGIGGKTLTRIVARNDLLGRAPGEFLALSPEALIEEYRFRPAVAEEIGRRLRDSLDLWRPMQDRLDKLGVTIATSADLHYPSRTEQFEADPPGVLFLYGNTKLLNAKTFCVLSSRNTSPRGLARMEELVEDGVLGGEVLVSGHSTPEYQRSAVVPLRWGAPRILCLDRGFFDVLGEDLKEEPFRAARLWRYQFDERTDLVVSPFRPEAIFRGVNNQVRDRLIGGLSLRLDFVEIVPGRQMEKLAKMGLKAGRTVRVCDFSTGYLTLRSLGAQVLGA